MATRAGITVLPVTRYSLEPLPRGGLLFGFSGTDEEGIRNGVRVLAAALEGV